MDLLPELLTRDQLAERLAVSGKTVNRWAWAGLIPRVKISAKIVRFNLAKVIQALEKAALKRAKK